MVSSLNVLLPKSLFAGPEMFFINLQATLIRDFLGIGQRKPPFTLPAVIASRKVLSFFFL
jgi:hypothetical protein